MKTFFVLFVCFLSLFRAFADNSVTLYSANSLQEFNQSHHARGAVDYFLSFSIEEFEDLEASFYDLYGSYYASEGNALFIASKFEVDRHIDTFHYKSLTDQRDLEFFLGSRISELKEYSQQRVSFKAEISTPINRIRSGSILQVIQIEKRIKNRVL